MSFPPGQISRLFDSISELPELKHCKTERDEMSNSLYKRIYFTKSEYADNIYNITNHHSEFCRKMPIALSTLERLLNLEPIIRKRFNLLPPNDVRLIFHHLLKELRHATSGKIRTDDEIREVVQSFLLTSFKDRAFLEGITNITLTQSNAFIYNKIMAELASNFDEVVFKQLTQKCLE